MKRGAFGSFVPGKKRKTSTLPEEVADDVVEKVCKIGGEWAAQDEEPAPEEEAAPDEEHAACEEGAEDEDEEAVHDDEVQDEEWQGEEVQDNDVQYEKVEHEEAQDEEDDAELIDDEAVQEEDAQDAEVAPKEFAEDNDQVAVEEGVMQETEREAEDDDIANQDEALANETALDSEAAPEEETNLCEAPNAAEAEMDELAKLGKEVELAKKAAAPDSHVDDDDVPAPDYLQDQPDSDSSSSSDSTSASSGKAAKAISDSSSLLDLLGGGSDLSVGDTAVVPEVQGEEADNSSAAQRLERKLASDLAKLGPKKRAVRVAQLSKWLWDRLQASSLPSGLEEAHEVEALISRIAGEPDAGEPNADIPQPSTPPHRKGKRKTDDVVQRQLAEPSHREPLSEPLWPILSHYPQHSGFSIRFAKKKALCETTTVESFREVDLWFQNPGQSVSCEWCEDSVPQSFGTLQGAEGRSTLAQCEFVCFTCIQAYGCGE